MGNRLTKIYTRTGDDGSTGLATGQRVPKDCPRVEAFGTVDELNCWLGMVLEGPGLPAPVRTALEQIQHRLFDLGGELAVPGRQVILPADTTALEALLDQVNGNLPPLSDFVLPGGAPGAAACHLARAVCRRAERRLLSLQRQEAINPESLRYLNRLSDLLFVISRVVARAGGGTEVTWKARPKD